MKADPSRAARSRDGPQSGYSAQGKSGNQKPMDFEQGGRSAGGREGESNGEMVGKVADDLEGRARSTCAAPTTPCKAATSKIPAAKPP